jgi:hypothetical protein
VPAVIASGVLGSGARRRRDTGVCGCGTLQKVWGVRGHGTIGEVGGESSGVLGNGMCNLNFFLMSTFCAVTTVGVWGTMSLQQGDGGTFTVPSPKRMPAGVSGQATSANGKDEGVLLATSIDHGDSRP